MGIRLEEGNAANGERFYGYCHNVGSSYGAVLEITYETTAPPHVATHEATDITATSAVGHGEITDTGGAEVVERGFEWGTEPGVYPNSVTEEI